MSSKCSTALFEAFKAGVLVSYRICPNEFEATVGQVASGMPSKKVLTRVLALAQSYLSWIYVTVNPNCHCQLPQAPNFLTGKQLIRCFYLQNPNRHVKQKRANCTSWMVSTDLLCDIWSRAEQIFQI